MTTALCYGHVAFEFQLRQRGWRYCFAGVSTMEVLSSQGGRFPKNSNPNRVSQAIEIQLRFLALLEMT